MYVHMASNRRRHCSVSFPVASQNNFMTKHQEKVELKAFLATCTIISPKPFITSFIASCRYHRQGLDSGTETERRSSISRFSANCCIMVNQGTIVNELAWQIVRFFPFKKHLGFSKEERAIPIFTDSKTQSWPDLISSLASMTQRRS